MNKNATFIMATLLSAIILLGCSKEEETIRKNSFTIGDVDFPIISGNIENYGLDDKSDPDWQYDGTNFDLSFSSNGATFDSNSAELEYVGNGGILYFELFSSNADEIASGTYTYDDSSPFAVNTFDYGYHTDDVDDGDYFDIVSGTIKIKKNGDEYEIEFSGKDENDKTIISYYKGALRMFDYTNNSGGRKKK